MWLPSIENYHVLKTAIDNYNVALITGNSNLIAKTSDSLTKAVKHTCGLD